MKTIFLFLPITIFFVTCTFAQTISNVKVSQNTFCPDSKINVTFETTGTFDSRNAFIAQLSDENGAFTSFTNLASTNSSANYI